MNDEERIEKLAEVMNIIAELPPIHWLQIEAFIKYIRASSDRKNGIARVGG